MLLAIGLLFLAVAVQGVFVASYTFEYAFSGAFLIIGLLSVAAAFDYVP